MGGGKKENSSQTDDLGQYARLLFNETARLRNELTAQGLEALQTGGISARLPIIARALEASKSAASQSRQQTIDSLARSNLAGTPFGQAILAQQEIQGNQHTADIPTQYASNVIGLIPQYITALTGQGITGLGGAASAQTGLYGSYNNAYGQTTNTLASKGFSAATGALSGAATGAAVGGPWGAAIGGIAGAAKSFF